jgi:hypothetical protein
MAIQMNTTKTLLLTVALATAASLSFAQAPAAPKAAQAALTSATAKAPTHTAAKRLHAKKHHPAAMKHSSQAAKSTGPTTP